MSSTKTSTLNKFPKFTIGEAAELTNSSSPTIRRMIERGELRAYRFGRGIRIGEEDLSAAFSEVNPTTYAHVQGS